VAEVKTARRFYLHKRHMAAQYEDSDLDLTWRAKQEAEPGSALPEYFPHQAALEAQGYTKREDIDGADAAELVRAGLTQRQATDVIAAFAAL